MAEGSGTWHAVAGADEVEEDDVAPFEVRGCSLALFHLEDGSYHVTDDRCTHQEASLSEGYLEGDIIECPRHQGLFHVPTGRPKAAPVVAPLRVYPVKVEDGQVWVRLPE
ncbi:non-heme iron oxygenase ferredoxin subunit [Streptomyces boninensis]|uniref:non-heme iron oxygenase ferredoxin subunit n=1 Tax=Streptomyces boninensis TaxID=2039455 RepID=UPI003B214752